MNLLLAVLDDRGGALRFKLVGIYSILIAANLLVWAWAVAAFRNQPLLLGTALIAYGFGLRHAVDADHIAAIDNVTRKLMQQRKHPIAVGFFFALGHSTVVVVASCLIALTASNWESRFPAAIEIGGEIGTSVSALVLFFIAILNLLVMAGVFQLFRRVRRGGKYAEDELNALLAGRGGLGRLIQPLFRLISHSWHMYPLGFLFGLGFDTASEIGLLGISAEDAAKGWSMLPILVFPALFTAGMSLVDTSDGILMLGAYGWAFVNPARKLFYNLAITLISVIVAVAVGIVELLGLAAGKAGWVGGLWDAVATTTDHFDVIGYFIVALFVASWLVSVVIYRAIGLKNTSAARASRRLG